jgi:hypothetical protein
MKNCYQLSQSKDNFSLNKLQMIGNVVHRLKQKELYNGYYHFIRRKFNFKRKRSQLNYLNNLRKNIQEKMFNRE